METKVKADRKYKDALFTFIFGNEKHKEFALSLYNAMNRSDYTNADGLEIITLGKVLFIKMKNDVAYLVQSEMFLYEQQSSLNPNIPYRCLEYAVGEYQRYFNRRACNKYSRRMFAMPAPHFIVLSNGTEEMPESFLIKKMLMDEIEEVKGMIFGEYDEALDKQEQEKYVREETEIARSTGRKEGIGIGEKQKAIEMAESTLKRFPDWSDQEVADCVKDISAEEVFRLRKGEQLD